MKWTLEETGSERGLFSRFLLFGRDANAEPPNLGMDLEEAFQIVGDFGAYQKRAVAVLVLTQVGKRKTRGFNCV